MPLKKLRTVFESPPPSRDERTMEGAWRLDRAVQHMTGLSRSGVRALLDHGCVRINDIAASRGQSELRLGDVVLVEYDPNRRYKEKPKVESDPAYQILFEDEHLLVVDKAAHVLTVPTASGKGKTLIEALQRHLNRGKPSRSHKRLHVVHRLDQGVSGVLVVAKNAAIAEQLKGQFAAHKPQRIYVAIVGGVMESQRGTFRSRLVTDYDLNRRSTTKPGQGELAITHYEVMEKDVKRQFTVVRVQLETGRRNQIRVHFAEAGHAVLGDPRYPSAGSRGKPVEITSSSHPLWRARRLALHAASLEFSHPTTGSLLRFESPLPREFQRLMKARP